MNIEKTIKTRLQNLINEGEGLRRSNENGQVRSDKHAHECKGWIAAALQLVKTICPDPSSAYHHISQKIADTNSGYTIQDDVGRLSEVLKNLSKDIDLGLVGSLANQISAEVFDNFLDHAVEYYKLEKKNEGGVIAGVVFEDTLRRVCMKHGIHEKDEKIDELISHLTKKGALTQIKAKRARVAANVRTKATHAQWDDFDMEDLKATIDFAKELISDQLDS